jgi:hypothetical protein
MDYGMIGKIDKAKRYSAERGKRVQFQSFSVTVAGDNNSHTVRYDNGTWQCDCDFFRTRGRCVHTITLEMILESMVTAAEPVQQA